MIKGKPCLRLILEIAFRRATVPLLPRGGIACFGMPPWPRGCWDDAAARLVLAWQSWLENLGL